MTTLNGSWRVTWSPRGTSTLLQLYHWISFPNIALIRLCPFKQYLGFHLTNYAVTIYCKLLTFLNINSANLNHTQLTDLEVIFNKPHELCFWITFSHSICDPNLPTPHQPDIRVIGVPWANIGYLAGNTHTVNNTQHPTFFSE